MCYENKNHRTLLPQRTLATTPLLNSLAARLNAPHFAALKTCSTCQLKNRTGDNQGDNVSDVKA